MKGLLLKDWYTLIKQMKIMLVLMLVFACVPGYSMAAFAVVYAAMLPVTALAYDERSKWDELAAMLPYSVREIVGGKYVLGVTAVAAILQHNTSGVISRAGEGITSAKGMENKIYSTWDIPVELAMIRYCMELEGADFDTVKLIPNNITDEPAALRAHQTDSVWIFYGWSGINAELSDFDFDYWDFRSISEDLDYYTPVIIANNEFLKNSPETAKAFLEATVKGYEYAIAHPEEAAEMLIAGDTTGSLEDARDLVYASQKWLADQYTADAKQWGVFDPARWDAFYSWLYTNGLTAHDLTGIGFTNEFLP